jgi:hypothetical protein
LKTRTDHKEMRISCDPCTRDAFVVRLTPLRVSTDSSVRFAYPTLLRSTSATRDPGAELYSRVCLSSIAQLKKYKIRCDGTNHEGGGGRSTEPVSKFVILG